MHFIWLPSLRLTLRHSSILFLYPEGAILTLHRRHSSSNDFSAESQLLSLSCMFFLIDPESPVEMCQPQSLSRKPHDWENQSHPLYALKYACGVWESHPSNCEHLLVANCKLTGSDDQPPASRSWRGRECRQLTNCT